MGPGGRGGRAWSLAVTPRPLPSTPGTHNHGPQHRDEGAEAAALLDQRLPDRLLLRFFQQEIFIVDVLERAVQLRLDIASSCKGDKARADTPASRASAPVPWGPGWRGSHRFPAPSREIKPFLDTQRGPAGAAVLGPARSEGHGSVGFLATGTVFSGAASLPYCPAVMFLSSRQLHPLSC